MVAGNRASVKSMRLWIKACGLELAWLLLQYRCNHSEQFGCNYIHQIATRVHIEGFPRSDLCISVAYSLHSSSIYIAKTVAVGTFIDLNCDTVFVEMTDLLREFDEPAVMDIKIGIRYTIL